MSEVVITRSDQGKTFDVHQNDLITIRLAENATTGYRWQADIIDNRIVELLTSDYRVAPGAGVGGGGVRTFVLRTKSVGATSIQLRLRQAWEPEDANLDRFEIIIRTGQ